MTTNANRAEAAFGIEQLVRAIDRMKIHTCVEHGFRRSRCAELGLYHADGKVRHGCIKEQSK